MSIPFMFYMTLYTYVNPLICPWRKDQNDVYVYAYKILFFASKLIHTPLTFDQKVTPFPIFLYQH